MCESIVLCKIISKYVFNVTLKYLFWFNRQVFFIKLMKRKMFSAFICYWCSLCSAGREWGALLLFPALWEQRSDSHSTEMQVCVIKNQNMCFISRYFGYWISWWFKAVSGGAGYDDDSLVKIFWLVLPVLNLLL